MMYICKELRRKLLNRSAMLRDGFFIVLKRLPTQTKSVNYVTFRESCVTIHAKSGTPLLIIIFKIKLV